jgi:protein phosphatase
VLPVRLGASHGATDTGRKRRRNEDAFVCAPPLFAVADGMGGAQAGEVASELAAATLRESHTVDGGEDRIVALVREANRRVHERAATDASASGMGTTITAALVAPDGTIAVGHVGDSRAYRLRGSDLEQLTNDHSLVAELVRRGELSPAEAEVHPQRSVITRALGTDPDIDVDAFTTVGAPGDLYLLCSDGLSSMVDARAINDILVRSRADLPTAARALVDAANRSGGEDNVTVVLFEVIDGEELPAVGEPSERTQEYAASVPDDEDTLHPEDRVRIPDQVDTMVVSAAEVQAALDESSLGQGSDGEGVLGQEHEQPPVHRAGVGQHLLALLVIVGLVALILFLVWRGLAR